MNNRLRSFWFDHYLKLVLAALFFVVIIILSSEPIDHRFRLIITSIGVALTTIYFVQKQKLEEIKLFKELFTEFNARYDQMNGDISDLKAGKITEPEKIEKVLDDYFNLCAEEYLFYREGRIHQLAWEAWCRGMEEHLKASVIREYWQRAEIEDSYYGLTAEAMKSGANARSKVT